MSVWTSSSGTLRPVNENSPSSGLWNSWKTASSPASWRYLRPRDVALEEEDLGDLLLALLLGDHEAPRLVRADERLDHGREVEEPQVALELLAGGARDLERGRLEPLGEHQAQVAGEGRQRVHQVEEDRLLDREQLGVLRRAHGGAARRAGEERQLAQHLAGAEIGDRHRLGAVAWEWTATSSTPLLTM